MAAGRVLVCSGVQIGLENALFPMLVTLFGIVTVVRLVHPENLELAMLQTPLPIATLVRPQQPPKAW
jgi:hypothetical protein